MADWAKVGLGTPTDFQSEGPDRVEVFEALLTDADLASKGLILNHGPVDIHVGIKTGAAMGGGTVTWTAQNGDMPPRALVDKDGTAIVQTGAADAELGELPMAIIATASGGASKSIPVQVFVRSRKP